MAPERIEQKMRRANKCSFGKGEAETKERKKRKLAAFCYRRRKLSNFATEDGNCPILRVIRKFVTLRRTAGHRSAPPFVLRQTNADRTDSR